jgi:uncharacterized protein (TIGR03067 family)
MKTLLLTFLVAASSIISTFANDAADTRALQGTWLLVKGEVAAKPLPDVVVKGIVMKLNGNNYTVTANGQPDVGTWSIDASTTPKSMNVKGVQGPNAGRTFPCIYDVEGDTLRICYNLSGAKRPTEFETVAGSQLFLATYQRKK